MPTTMACSSSTPALSVLAKVSLKGDDHGIGVQGVIAAHSENAVAVDVNTIEAHVDVIDRGESLCACVAYRKREWGRGRGGSR